MTNSPFSPIPSVRLATALDDLIAFEQLPYCHVDMYCFHENKGGVCFACLGGASSIMRLDPMARPATRLALECGGVSGYDLKQFEVSLDAFRVGHVSYAFQCMGLDKNDGFKFNRDITDYHKYREGFFRDMRKLVDDLKEAGF